MIVSLFNSPPEIVRSYLVDGEGTQIVLSVPDEEALLRLLDAARAAGIPTSLVVERDRKIAVGIGPVMREVAAHLTKDLERMK